MKTFADFFPMYQCQKTRCAQSYLPWIQILMMFIPESRMGTNSRFRISSISKGKTLIPSLHGHPNSRNAEPVIVNLVDPIHTVTWLTTNLPAMRVLTTNPLQRRRVNTHNCVRLSHLEWKKNQPNHSQSPLPILS